MAGLLVSFAAGAAGTVRDAAPDVAADLVFVASCPDPAGAAGSRVLVFRRGFEHVSSEVYLQWLEWNEDGPRVIASARVAELSSGMWSVGEPVLVSRRSCSLRLAASNPFSSETARFVLRPAGRGKYVIRELAR